VLCILWLTEIFQDFNHIRFRCKFIFSGKNGKNSILSDLFKEFRDKNQKKSIKSHEYFVLLIIQFISSLIFYLPFKLFFMKNLPFSMLSSNELYTTSCRIVEACKLSLSGNEFVSTLCSSVDMGNSDLGKGLGKSLNSDFTPLLILRDQARDNAFIGLRDFASSFSHSNDEGKAAAGKNLTGIFDTTGNSAYSMGYSVETAKLNSLIMNLSTPASLKDMESIGAIEWFEQLKTCQVEFEKVYNSKIDTESAINFPLIKDARDRITKYLKALLSYININTELDPVKYGPVSDKIDEMITEIVAIARARKTRKGNVPKKSEKATV